MRLEIKSGLVFTNNGSLLFKALERRKNVVKTFKAVRSGIYNMDGGVGNLQSAVNDLSSRITKVETVQEEKIKTAGERLGMFLKNAGNTDRKVARMIAVNQGEFFKANPWAVPPPPPKKKSIWEKIKDGFKKVGKAIVGGIKKAAKWVADTAKKVWKKTVDFCKKHWKAIVKIVVGVVIIAGLAALSVFTGGAAAPLFAVAAKGAAIAACTSAAVTVVSGVAQGQSFGEIFDAGANSFMIGAITGAASGAAGAAAGAVTSATGSQVLGKLTEVAINTGAKMLAEGASYTIDNGTVKGFMKAKGYDILKEGGMSCLSVAGDYLKGVGKDLLGKTFSGLKDSQLFNSMKNAYQAIEKQAPTLTKVVTNAVKETAEGITISDLAQLKNPSEFAKNIGKTLIGNLASGAQSEIGNFINTDLNNITGGAVDKAKGYISDIAGTIKDSNFGKAISGAYDSVSGAFSNVKDQLGSAVNSTMDLIGKSVGSFQGQVKDIFGGITSEFKTVKGAFSGALDTISDKVGSIGSFAGKLDNIGGVINKGINAAISKGTSFISKNISGIQGNLGKVIGSAVNGFSKVALPNLNNVLGKAVGSIGSSVNKTIGSLTSGINKSIGSISTGINKSIDYIASGLNSSINSAASNIGDAVNSVSKIGNSFLNGTLSSAGKSFASVFGSVSKVSASSMTSSITQATNVVSGFLSKIRL